MTPGKVSKRVVGDKLDWISKMLTEINLLPLGSYEEFIADSRNIWTAESCLRRALEALFDLGMKYDAVLSPLFASSDNAARRQHGERYAMR